MECQTRADFGAFIPSQLDDYPLDPFEFRIYARIVRRAGSKGCFESLPKMAAGCKMGLTKARVAIRVLAKAGFIQLVDRSKEGLSHLCWITSPSEWVSPELVEKIRKSLVRSKKATPIESNTPIQLDTTPPIQLDTTPPIQLDTTPLSDQIPEGIPYKESKLNYSNEGEAPPPKNKIEVEVLEPEVVPESLLPVHIQKKACPDEQTNSGQGHFSAAEPENLKILQEIQAIAYDWRKRPWMLNAIEFKSEVVASVWLSNTDWYSLPNSNPNHKKINDRLKKLDNSLQGIGKQAALAYIDLNNYWKTASELTNPETAVNAQQLKDGAKQASKHFELESKKQRIGNAIAHL